MKFRSKAPAPQPHPTETLVALRMVCRLLVDTEPTTTNALRQMAGKSELASTVRLTPYTLRSTAMFLLTDPETKQRLEQDAPFCRQTAAEYAASLHLAKTLCQERKGDLRDSLAIYFDSDLTILDLVGGQYESMATEIDRSMDDAESR